MIGYLGYSDQFGLRSRKKLLLIKPIAREMLEKPSGMGLLLTLLPLVPFSTNLSHHIVEKSFRQRENSGMFEIC